MANSTKIVVSTTATMSVMVSLLGETDTALVTWYEARNLASRIKVASHMWGK